MMFNQVGKELDVNKQKSTVVQLLLVVSMFLQVCEVDRTPFLYGPPSTLTWLVLQTKKLSRKSKRIRWHQGWRIHMTSKIRFSAIHLSPVCLPQREPQNPGVGEMRLMLNPSAGDQTRSASFGQNMSKPFQHDEWYTSGLDDIIIIIIII